MANTKTKGQIAEAAVMFALLKNGYTVLVPYGENQSYDLVIDKDGFKKVQCKMARFNSVSLKFNIFSVVRSAETKKWKKVFYDDVDLYGVYSPDLKRVYLIPASDIKAKGEVTIALTDNRKGLVGLDYEIGR